MFLSFETYAQRSNQINSLERQRNELQQKINQTDKELRSIKNETKKEERKISLLERQVKQRESMISLLENEMSDTQKSIDSISAVINILNKKEIIFKDKYKKSILHLTSKNVDINNLAFILSSKNIEQALAREQFIAKYTSAIKDNVDSIKSVISKKEEAKQSYDHNLKTKQNLFNNRQAEKTKLENDKKNKSIEVQKLKEKGDQLAQILKKQRNQQAILTKKIEEQIAKEIEESRRREELKRKNSIKKSSSSSNKKEENKSKESLGSSRNNKEYIMNDAEIKLSGSFAKNKGNLPMPVRGSYSIESHFGVHHHNEHDRVLTNNPGIDISPKSNDGCFAVFDGIVTRVFITPGYNNSVIVRHGDYLTVYSNLANVTVSQGVSVKAGQRIGTIAKDELKNQTKLHFQIWHEQTKQNPEIWLKR